MNNKITIIVFIFSLNLLAQSKSEIANVYFKKAEKSMEVIDYRTAEKYYNKGLDVLDTVTKARTAQQGVFIYFELKKYEKAKKFAKQFFNVSKNKSSEDYAQMLELYVDIEEKLLMKKEESEKLVKKEKAKKAALRRIDSLEKVWETTKAKFTLRIDSLHNFNKEGISLFKKDDFYGVIDDTGNIIVEADTYKEAKQNEGYFILIDDKKSPKRIYSYNSNNEKSVLVLDPIKYNKKLSNYGIITLPRANGKLVMYPDEISETLIYDLEEEKFIKITNIKEFLKEFKKNDKVDKYNYKEQTVKIGKEWYLFGNHIGGQVHTLYSSDKENKVFSGYLFADQEQSKFVKKDEVGYLGFYHSNKLAADNEDERLWYTKEGEEASQPVVNNIYKGTTKIIKTDKGYQLSKDGIVFLRNEKLQKLQEFLKVNE